MILDDEGLIFVHIARTGGTSIETALTGNDWWKISPETKHLSARQLRVLVGEDKWTRYFKFSVVRNPWDRVISMFATGWWMSSGRQSDPQAEFEHFINNLAPHPHEKYSTLLYSEIIDERLDVIIRFEDLQRGFDKVCEAIGRPSIVLPKEESRDRLHYSLYYTDATRRSVEELFRDDIEQYKYAFERRAPFSLNALSSLCDAAIIRSHHQDDPKT
jgi:Sulfotransferase family